MSAVTVALDLGRSPGDPRSRARSGLDLAGLPVRVLVTPAALDLLADRAGVVLPWPRPGSAQASVAERLSAPLPDRRDRPAPGPEAELAGLGILGPDGDIRPDVLAALATFAAAPVSVDLDLARSTGGGAQLHAWHRRAADRVTWLTVTGGRVELGWCDVTWWQAQLAGLVAGAPSGASGGAPLPGLLVELPLLLASAEAVRHGQDALLAELVRQHPGGVGAPEPLAPPAALIQLRRAHGGVLGRLRATVAGYGASGDRRIGVVSWLRYTDGWRALTPVRSEGRPRVLFEPVSPQRLGAEVARLSLGVRR